MKRNSRKNQLFHLASKASRKIRYNGRGRESILQLNLLGEKRKIEKNNSLLNRDIPFLVVVTLVLQHTAAFSSKIEDLEITLIESYLKWIVVL